MKVIAVNNDERRRHLFDHYMRNLVLFKVNPAGIFVCPLCQDGIRKEALDGKEPYLTLAHVIPDKLGGRLAPPKSSDSLSEPRTQRSGVSGRAPLAPLRCVRGSERIPASGEDFDRARATLYTCLLPMQQRHRQSVGGALLRRFKNEDALAGVGRLSGRLAGPFGHVGVEVQLTPDRKATSIYLVPKQSHPGHQQALDAYCARLAQDPQGMPEFDFTPTYRHEPRRVAAALYHAAYLLLFSYFGYEVAFHPNFKLVRTQILRPDEEILPTTFPLLDEASVASALGRVATPCCCRRSRPSSWPATAIPPKGRNREVVRSHPAGPGRTGHPGRAAAEAAWANGQVHAARTAAH